MYNIFDIPTMHEGQADQGDKTENLPLKEQTAELMLDVAYRRWEEAADDKRNFDTKASIILAADGVLVGFLANAMSSIVAINKTPLTVVFTIIVISLTISAIGCVLVLDVRLYDSFYLKEFKTSHSSSFENKVDLTDKIYDTLADFDDQYSAHVEEMRDHYMVAIVAFALAMIIMAVYIGLYFYLTL